MEKILVIGDIHLGEYSYPIITEDLLAQIVVTAICLKPSIVLVTGDAFKTNVPSAYHVSMFGSFLKKVAAVCPIIMIPGNHDIAGHGATTLDVYDGYENVKVVKSPVIVEHNNYQIVAVPWLPQKALISSGMDSENTYGVTQELLNLLSANLDTDKTSILLAHCTALGTKYHDGAPTTLGNSVLWRNDWFDMFDVCFLGHLHNPHMVPGTSNAFYVGSIFPTSFNEDRQEKSIILYNGDVARLPLNSPTMVTISASQLNPSSSEYKNCILRITKDVDEPDPGIPECLWYEIISTTKKAERISRVENASMLEPKEAVIAWLKMTDNAGEVDVVTALMAGL